MANTDDDISRWHNANPGVFELWVNTWQDMVYNTALGMLMNETDAEDVAQDVFVALYRNSHTFRGEAAISTWLYRVTINRCTDVLRQRKRGKTWWGKREEPSAGDWITFEHPGVLAENKDHATVLFNALQRLPHHQRTAFVLNKMEGLRVAEVAEIMKRSVSGVESLLSRANQHLRQWLKNYYEAQVNTK
ncbi:MAG: RNA polymerase sigma factor [Ferruginibacter sp.]|nr:RNA polymerase sigma factor [Ferruginibacter sp.]